jgi:ATPase family associated with various cellular activities (AAA)
MRTHKRKIRDLKRRPNRITPLTEHDILDPEQDKDRFTDEQYMLCTQKLFGFVLKERIWDLLDVSSVKKPKFQDDMIDDLVLKEEAKTLVQALSNSHGVPPGTDPYMPSAGLGVTGAPTRWSADFVQNKGEGRIFLLHGKPGVGKTTTAECVAEQSRSPLLSITCGDLGIYPDEVEKNLMKWLKLATLWKAVLLLDEADVYLESRISGDLQRNSLVSIFLRALEYYQGLLFLTTNRIGTFDEALISRIHVVLHYPDFTDPQRQTIWLTSFRKLQDERPDIQVGAGVMDYALEHEDLKKLKWNGREIRNAFNTIVALAEFDAEKKRRAKPGEEKKVVVRLERTHLKQVVEMSAKFKEYMRRTKGMDESRFQHIARIRDGDIVEDHRDPRRGHRG